MVDIVIVNWNSGDYLQHCISSIISTPNESLVGAIIIIDNHSSDDSLRKIPSHPGITIIRNSQNRGFSAACNQGFRACKSKYVLLLNPDARLLPDTLGRCVAFSEKHPDVDILGCALLNDKGNVSVSCARFPKPYRYFTDAVGLTKLLPHIFKPAVLMTDWNHASSADVDQVMGAFMFMPVAVFDKVGYFDERYFVYYEELDFSKRVKENGGRIFFNTEIKAVHSGEGTTSSVKAFRLFLSLTSRLQYARKHYRFLGWLMVWLTTMLIEPLTRSFFCLLKREPEGVVHVAKAYFMLMKHGYNLLSSKPFSIQKRVAE